MINISIVLPVLNVESWIKKCLDSLINQNFIKDEYEIIVIDNGSKDNTLKIIEEYKERITILFAPTKGASIARNMGINTAKGDIIAFIDGDCIADQNWIKELYYKFEVDKFKEIGCVVGNVISHRGKTVVENFTEKSGILSQQNTLNSRFLPFGQTANVSFRKEVFEKIGKFDESIVVSGEDADLAWRMQLKTNYKLIFCLTSVVEHCHRTSFVGLFKQQFKYGTGIIYLSKKYGSNMFINTNKNNTNKNIIVNLIKSLKLILSVLNFYPKSIGRLFGFFDKYQMYEPLLSFINMSGYGLGKIYGSLKFKTSICSVLLI